MRHGCIVSQQVVKNSEVNNLGKNKLRDPILISKP
jgi:hypothetical protein